MLKNKFRHLKIQPKTINLSIEPKHLALGNKPRKHCSDSPEPRAEVLCSRLNYNASKCVYSDSSTVFTSQRGR